MTAKEYLNDYKRIKRQRHIYMQTLSEVENDIISIGGVNYGDKVNSSPKNDPIGNVVIELTNKKAKLGLDIAALRAKELIIENQIAKMKNINTKYYEILVYRYMFSYDWRSICEIIGYGRSQANEVHGRALQKFEEIFLKNLNIGQIGHNRTLTDI